MSAMIWKVSRKPAEIAKGLKLEKLGEAAFAAPTP